MVPGSKQKSNSTSTAALTVLQPAAESKQQHEVQAAMLGTQQEESASVTEVGGKHHETM